MTTRRLATLALLLLAPLLLLASAWRLHDEVPDPVPVHWDVHGQVDGTAGFGTFTVLVLAVCLLAALAGAVLVVLGGRARGWVALMLGWLAWLCAVLYALTLLVSSGARRAADVDLPWWLLVLALAVPVVVGLVLLRLLPPLEATAVPDAPALALGADERVAWFGSARSVGMAWLGGLLALVGVAVGFLQPAVGAVLLASGVLLWWLHVLTVRVDAGGLRATWGPLAWPGRRVPLADIAGAEATDLEPLQWGGWGYRISPRGTALVVRRGRAIVVHRHSGSDLAVTVDDADRAAALLNGLVARSAPTS